MARDYIEQLKQCMSATWDGHLICKSDRDQLNKHGLIMRVGGFNIITKKGIRTLLALGLLRP